MIELGMADRSFQAVAPFLLAAHGRGRVALLAGNDDASFAVLVVIAIAAVDIDPSGIDAACSHRLRDRRFEGMAVIGRFFKSFRSEDEALTVGRSHADLGADFVTPRRYSAAEAGCFRGAQAVELAPAVLSLSE